ncbi:ERCC-8 DNA repair [Schizosaccharomyces japonicus yFS275]|uniref:ERCC-8 DNA repair n=1 Tax=Schizosaccharomyces japonicus (strain yFS275 / FY16936) TaxID=402676 RepID=B6K737_SCHJY|nr:ERCC-8 DNA repair [Schizosaccharomyces japonicus yFS275]EEB09341.1 ERCC-8 DNA repair [Schizosaccharomyces japonicus yFS275]
MESFLLVRQWYTDYQKPFRLQVYQRLMQTLRLSNPNCIRRRHGPGAMSAVTSLSIDNTEHNFMISGAADSSINLWNLLSLNSMAEEPLDTLNTIPARHGHTHGITDLHWFPFDNGMFTSSSFDHTIRVWDTQAMEQAYCFQLGDIVYSHAWSPIASHCLIAAAYNSSSIRLCDMQSGSYTHSLIGHTGRVLAVSWCPAREYVLASGGTDGTCRLWDVRKASSSFASLDSQNMNSPLEHSNRAHNGTINGLEWTPDAAYLVSSGTDDHIRVWDMDTGQNTLIHFGPTIHNQRQAFAVHPCVFQPDSDSKPLILFPNDDGTIVLLDTLTGTSLSRLSTNFLKRVNSVVYRKGYEQCLSGDMNGSILLWEPEMYTRPITSIEAEAEDTRNAVKEIYESLKNVPITFQ